jgi:hypothetical protein
MSSLKLTEVIYVRENLDSSRYLTTANAAHFLNIKATLLRSWRSRRIGPTYIKINRQPRGAVLYREADLVAFLRDSVVLAERMPRPMGGRLPGGKNKPKAGKDS